MASICFMGRSGCCGFWDARGSAGNLDLQGILSVPGGFGHSERGNWAYPQRDRSGSRQTAPTSGVGRRFREVQLAARWTHTSTESVLTAVGEEQDAVCDLSSHARKIHEAATTFSGGEIRNLLGRTGSPWAMSRAVNPDTGRGTPACIREVSGSPTCASVVQRGERRSGRRGSGEPEPGDQTARKAAGRIGESERSASWNSE